MKKSIFGRPFEDLLAEQMKDPEFAAEYNRLGPEYEVIEAMIDAKIKKGFSQADIAKRMGTTQSAVSRALSGSVKPSLDFLQRYALAIDKKLKIDFV